MKGDYIKYKGNNNRTLKEGKMKKIITIVFGLLLVATLAFADEYGVVQEDFNPTYFYRFDWTATAPISGETGYGLPGWRSATDYDADGGSSGFVTQTSSIDIVGRIFKVEIDPKGTGVTAPTDQYTVVLSAVTPDPVTVGVTAYPVSGAIPVAPGASGSSIFVVRSGSTVTETRPDNSAVSTWTTGPATVNGPVTLTVLNACRPEVSASPYATSGSVTIYYIADAQPRQVSNTAAKKYTFNYTTDENGDYTAASTEAINGWIYRIVEVPYGTGYIGRDLQLTNTHGVDILEGVGMNAMQAAASWSVPSAATAFATPRFTEGILNLLIDQADGGVSPTQKQGQVHIYYLPGKP